MEFPTRVQDNSVATNEYIVTDLLQIDKLQTVVSDSLLRSLLEKEIGQNAISMMSTKTTEQRSQVLSKIFFDKSNYKIQITQQLISDSFWVFFYEQFCAEGIFTSFTKRNQRAQQNAHQ